MRMQCKMRTGMNYWNHEEQMFEQRKMDFAWNIKIEEFDGFRKSGAAM